MESFYFLIGSVSIGALVGYVISRLTCRGEHKRERIIMNLVRDTTKDYSCSYSYRRIERRKQRRNLIIWNRIVGSILLLLSFFVLYMLPDQDGNWTLTALLIIVSAALFVQTGGLKHE